MQIWRLLVVLALLLGTACGGEAPPPGHRIEDGQPVRYLAVGASDALGFGADDGQRDGWPNVLLRTALPPSSVLEVAAWPGATTEDVLARANQIESVESDLTTVWLAVNDLRSGMPLQDYEDRLEQVLLMVGRGGTSWVLVGNIPPLDGLPAILACVGAEATTSCPDSAPPDRASLNELVDRYNDAIAEVSDRTGATLVDLHAAGLQARAEGREAALISSDGLHPSTLGHRAIAETFADTLSRARND